MRRRFLSTIIHHFDRQTLARLSICGSFAITGCVSSPTNQVSLEPPVAVRTTPSVTPVSQHLQTQEPGSAREIGEVEVAVQREIEEPKKRAIALTAATVGQLGLPAEPVPAVEIESPAPIPNGLSLGDLEAMALQHNPTIQQSSSSVHKGTGYRSQVGARPNPTVGFSAQQLADRGTDQHSVFVEQEFVTGGKLAWNQTVLNAGVQAQLWDVETRRQMVLTDVRRLFYAALAAQQRVLLTSEFHKVAEKGVEVARLRRKALEGSQADILQAEIQLGQIDLMRQQAEYQFLGAWRQLTATIGCPFLPPGPLLGTLPDELSSIDWDVELAQLLACSPELEAARARVQQARANLSRQEIQAIPNLTLQLGAGYDNGTDNGMLNLQIGAPIPVFNKNGGNISAAFAEYCRAAHEVQRIEMSIRARLAETAQAYDSALVAVNKYRNQLLPKADENLDLAEQAHQVGEIDFLQVLIVRRTFFETNLEFLTARRELAQAEATVRGMQLAGGLDAPQDFPGDSSLRDQTFSQQ